MVAKLLPTLLWLSSQISLSCSQVAQVPGSRPSLCSWLVVSSCGCARVKVGHPHVEEREHQHDHQYADHCTVHFLELPSWSDVLILLILLLELELFKSQGSWPCSCSRDILQLLSLLGRGCDALKPIWTRASRLNIKLIRPRQTRHPCLGLVLGLVLSLVLGLV